MFGKHKTKILTDEASVPMWRKDKLQRRAIVAARLERDQNSTPEWLHKVRKIRANRKANRQNRRLGRLHNGK